MRNSAYNARMNYTEAESRAAIFKALAHPVRVLIVDALRAGERCVCELNELAPIDPSGISRHLAVLKQAGILADRHEGTWVYYRLQTPCVLDAVHCAVEVARADAVHRNARCAAGAPA